MLTAHHLTKSYDLLTLFENVSFALNPGDRVGLVGPNGCGKTTLLRILAGLEPPGDGSVVRRPHLRVGYLPQGFEPDPHLSLGAILGQGAGDEPALEAQLAKAAAALAANPADPNLGAEYDALLTQVQSSDPGRVGSIMSGLGLADIDPTLPAGRLSGGQKTRLSLALVLLADPQVLLLDEPTNHLDIAMLEWLEDWLISQTCGILIVSHDRTFLDHTVTRILEMDPRHNSVREYTGNYSDYLAQHETEIEKQWAAYTDQRQEIQRMREDITRVKAQAAYTERQASSVRIGGRDMKAKGYKEYQRGIAKKVAKKAKAREKRLERYLESEERVEPPTRTQQIHIQFGETPHLGQSVFSLEEVSVGYTPGPILLQGLTLQVQPGQRIALTGPNGCGKTTLLRTLAGDLPPLCGKMRVGPTVRLGIMDQEQSSLHLEQTALETILPAFPNPTRARNFLASFLIAGDEPLKQVRLLSYGQRARLMLARLVSQGCNCLLLDEPINHLDIPSRTQFEEALQQFPGAVLAVIHDRYFIERFADEIWWVQDHGVQVQWVEKTSSEPLVT
jgi:ATP-binding cassette, subfamily F, member 3